MDEKGSLLAWDPAAQKLRWRVDYPFFLNAGTMTTAGNLVFQGTNTGKFHAYAADTGSAIKGNRIDLAVKDKKEEQKFNRQQMTVYILEKAKSW